MDATTARDTRETYSHHRHPRCTVSHHIQQHITNRPCHARPNDGSILRTINIRKATSTLDDNSGDNRRTIHTERSRRRRRRHASLNQQPLARATGPANGPNRTVHRPGLY